MPSDNAKVISFSGIDGAGKSTQIEALRAHLHDLGLRSALYTFWDNVAAFPRFREQLSSKAFKGDQGIGSPDKPISRRDKNISSWYITALRLILYLLDAYSLRVAISGICHGDVEFVIFDRYIYDEFANLPLDRSLVRFYVRLLLRLIPQPDIAFVVDADPKAAHIRKPEYPLDFVRTNRDSYIRLSRIVRNMTVLAPLSVEETTAGIREAIAKTCRRTDSETVEFFRQRSAGSCQAKTLND
jgi:thymidylate kinase